MANAKSQIILSLFNNRLQYADFTDYTEAKQLFSELENIPIEEVNDGYFKYFFRHGITEMGFDKPSTQISQDLQRYLAKNQKPNKPNLKTIMSADTNLDDIEIRFFKPGDSAINPDMFNAFPVNAEIDEIFSDDGGAMAATSIVVTGGPGVGKSTLLFWLARKYQELYPNHKVAVVSSEMEEEDLLYECRKKPWMNSLEFVLTSEYGVNLMPAMRKIYAEGYDIIILDSFADICDKLKDFNGLTGSQAEAFLLELLKTSKGGENKTGKYTLNLIIQQVTKGGNFAGSNKLKHNTTGMLELRRESSGDRYMTFTKNRRCGLNVGKKLYYFLGEGNNIAFDTERWEREKAGDEAEDQGENNSREQLTNDVIAQFGELSSGAAERIKKLLQHDGVTPELLQSIRPQTTISNLTLEDCTLPEGISIDNIEYDATLTMYCLEIGEDNPLYGDTKEEVIQALIEKFRHIDTDIIELDEEE